MNSSHSYLPPSHNVANTNNAHHGTPSFPHHFHHHNTHRHHRASRHPPVISYKPPHEYTVRHAIDVARQTGYLVELLSDVTVRPTHLFNEERVFFPKSTLLPIDPSLVSAQQPWEKYPHSELDYLEHASSSEEEEEEDSEWRKSIKTEAAEEDEAWGRRVAVRGMKMRPPSQQQQQQQQQHGRSRSTVDDERGGDADEREEGGEDLDDVEQYDRRGEDFYRRKRCRGKGPSSHNTHRPYRIPAEGRRQEEEEEEEQDELPPPFGFRGGRSGGGGGQEEYAQPAFVPPPTCLSTSQKRRYGHYNQTLFLLLLMGPTPYTTHMVTYWGEDTIPDSVRRFILGAHEIASVRYSKVGKLGKTFTHSVRTLSLDLTGGSNDIRVLCQQELPMDDLWHDSVWPFSLIGKDGWMMRGVGGRSLRVRRHTVAIAAAMVVEGIEMSAVYTLVLLQQSETARWLEDLKKAEEIYSEINSMEELKRQMKAKRQRIEHKRRKQWAQEDEHLSTAEMEEMRNARLDQIEELQRQEAEFVQNCDERKKMIIGKLEGYNRRRQLSCETYPVSMADGNDMTGSCEASDQWAFDFFDKHLSGQILSPSVRGALFSLSAYSSAASVADALLLMGKVSDVRKTQPSYIPYKR